LSSAQTRRRTPIIKYQTRFYPASVESCHSALFRMAGFPSTGSRAATLQFRTVRTSVVHHEVAVQPVTPLERLVCHGAGGCHGSRLHPDRLHDRAGPGAPSCHLYRSRPRGIPVRRRDALEGASEAGPALRLRGIPQRVQCRHPRAGCPACRVVRCGYSPSQSGPVAGTRPRRAAATIPRPTCSPRLIGSPTRVLLHAVNPSERDDAA